MIPDTPSGGIGARLHDARQREQLSLRQVSDTTKVPVDILRSIERNDISRVPGGLYVRGYVRSFAAVVGLDPESTVAEFVRQCACESVSIGYPATERLPESPGSPAPAAPVTADPRRPVRRTRWPLWRFATVAAAAAMAGAYAGVAQGERHRMAAETDGPIRVTVPRAAIAANPLPVLRAEELEGPAISRVPLESTPIDRVPSREAIPDRPVPERPALAGPLAVVVAASRPSWVIATVDGRRAVNRLLAGGERESFEARRDLVLTAGDAGAIVLTLNGRLARSIGPSGETATAHVSSANFRDFLRR